MATVEVACYATAWTIAYLGIRTLLFPHMSADYSNRAVSIGHAVIAMVMASASIPSMWHPFSRIGGSTTPAEARVLSISLGYFLYDTVCCLLISLDWANFLHHVCTMLGMAVGLVQGRCGSELVLCLLLMEVSNPFLHWRSMLKERDQGGTKLAAINDVLFATTFFLCRILIGPCLTYWTLISPSTTGLVKAGAAGIQVVSLFWFYRIMQILRYKLKVHKAKGKGH